MKLIKLTYFKSPTKHHTVSGPTSKQFYLNVLSIDMMTEYTDSTKLVLKSGFVVEVVESKELIMRLHNKK